MAANRRNGNFENEDFGLFDRETPNNSFTSSRQCSSINNSQRSNPQSPLAVPLGQSFNSSFLSSSSGG